MKLSSIYLEAFFELAQVLNFTKAAKSLGITQSAFSTRIINLERELAAKLITREKSNLYLTPTGETLLRYCEKAKKLEAEALRSILNNDQNQLSGVIRIGGFSSVMRSLVLPSIASLLRDYPNIGVETIGAELGDLIGLLKTSKVDYVFSNKDPGISGLNAEFLGYEINVLSESKEYEFNGCYLDHDPNDVTTSSYFKLKPELKTKLTCKRYLDDVYGLLDGVTLGLGRAILPEHLIKDEKKIRVLYPKTKLKVPVYLLYFENYYATHFDRLVLDNLRKIKSDLKD